MSAVHHAHLQHKVDDDLWEMQQEVIDLHSKMMKEDPEHFCSSDTALGHPGKTEMAVRNTETWKGAAWPEVPLKVCMLQLLDQLGMNTTGSHDVVQMHFKKSFLRDTVSFSNNQWHICYTPTHDENHNPNSTPSST